MNVLLKKNSFETDEALIEEIIKYKEKGFSFVEACEKIFLIKINNPDKYIPVEELNLDILIGSKIICNFKKEVKKIKKLFSKLKYLCVSYKDLDSYIVKVVSIDNFNNIEYNSEDISFHFAVKVLKQAIENKKAITNMSKVIIE